MAYKNLYRKYRPSSFDELVGQDYIKKTLVNAIKSNRISHAYLFTGPRGTGKTSFAKLFAKAINCLNFENGNVCNECDICKMINANETSDIIEIDAASNNGVDEIREIRNAANILPSKCRYKVYIIDEVHMLSSGAFNALLKTLEEPPSHVVFVLATTELQKLPLTIISRCQNFDFKKHTKENIVARLRTIVREENIEITDEAIEEIAYVSDGGLRDAIGLLDQLSSYSDDKISIEDVLELTGSISDDLLLDFVDAMESSEVEKTYQIIHQFYEQGKDFNRIAEKILILLKDILIMKKISNLAIEYKETKSEKLSSLSVKLESKKLYDLILRFNDLIADMKKTTQSKLLFEVQILRFMDYDKTKQEQSTEKNGVNKDVIEETIKKYEFNPIKPVEQEKIQERTKEPLEEKIERLEEENKELVSLPATTIESKLEEKSTKEYSISNKKVLINNTLAKSEKNYIENMKKYWMQLQTMLLNKELKEAASILIDAKIVAASDDHLFLTYKYQGRVEDFDQYLSESTKAIKQITGTQYKMVAINELEWEELRPYYVQIKKEKKEIEWMDENDTVIAPTKRKENKKNPKDMKELNELFGDSIIQMKG